MDEGGAGGGVAGAAWAGLDAENPETASGSLTCFGRALAHNYHCASYDRYGSLTCSAFALVH